MKSSLSSVHDKRILVRADLNVPIKNDVIADDFRLQALIPLLDMLIKNNNVIILATHLGRPKGKKIETLSTKILVPWFKNKGYHIIFETNLAQVSKTEYNPGTIVLLENLRFNSGEKNHDKTLAQQLAQTANYYVNDAFALLHRDDTSITDVPALFNKDKRFLGPLIKKEFDALRSLKHPEDPYVVLLGGGKVATKLPLITHLLKVASTIVLLPAIVFTFLKAEKKEIGKSLLDRNALDQAKKILESCQSKNKLIMPIDYQIACGSLQGPLTYVNAQQFPHDGIGISVGPKTLHMLTPIIQDAKTIFCNAAMGFANRPETMQGTYDLLKLIASSNAYSVIGGGDTVSAARKLGIESQFSYCSTGGGATLAYLAGQPLPGLKEFKQ